MSSEIVRLVFRFCQDPSSCRVILLDPPQRQGEQVFMGEQDFIMVTTERWTQPEMPSIFHLQTLKGHDLFEITVDELQHLYSSKAFTSREYTQFCLDRIQAINPYLEAVIETNPDALAIAEQLDDERLDDNLRGPLHGVPVLVKDVGTCSRPFSSPSHFLFSYCTRSRSSPQGDLKCSIRTIHNSHLGA